MPKIRDLGINAIPETMRPFEVGDGGYRLGGGTLECPDGTCDDDDDDVIDPDKDKDDKDDDNSPRDRDRSTGGINVLGIAQLRQQLDQYIASV